MDQGAVTLVLELPKAFEKVQLKVVLAWAMHFGSRSEFMEYFAGTFSTSEEESLRVAWQIRCRSSRQFFLDRS